ncbi:DUF5068 domain-containing protein [Oceanobacillus sojae]|uniref:Lipoprotein n=1 Tax=Oceanobacillus sojae TaxID=582851 RepID=A0A511ZDX3_9BACI|nr:DUF5068 domain-containing protein [Oceanobacillus sojae]GEN85630.1 hypothetical protein OSO01_03690 [Oceanobacillus sojae]
MEILDVKKNAYVLLAAIFAIVLTACGTETDEEEKPQTGSSNAEFDVLITAMEEETEGTATLLFENNESQSHEREGLSLTLDAYPLVELEDFYTNFSIPFGDQTDGGVILVQYTVKNDSDQDLHYMPTLNIDYVGATKHHNNYRDLIPLEEQLPTILAPDNEYLVEAEDKVTGYYAYPFGQDELEEILAEGNVIVDAPAPTTEYNEYSSTIGSGTEFTLPLDADNVEKVLKLKVKAFIKTESVLKIWAIKK